MFLWDFTFAFVNDMQIIESRRKSYTDNLIIVLFFQDNLTHFKSGLWINRHPKWKIMDWQTSQGKLYWSHVFQYFIYLFIFFSPRVVKKKKTGKLRMSLYIKLVHWKGYQYTPMLQSPPLISRPDCQRATESTSDHSKLEGMYIQLRLFHY